MNSTPSVGERITHFENTTRMGGKKNKTTNKASGGKSKKKNNQIDSSFDTVPVILGDGGGEIGVKEEDQPASDINIFLKGTANEGGRRRSTPGESSENLKLIKERARSLSTSGKPAVSSGKRKFEATMGDAEENINASLSDQPAVRRRVEPESTTSFVDAMKPLLASLENSVIE